VYQVEAISQQLKQVRAFVVNVFDYINGHVHRPAAFGTAGNKGASV
jgi:hypothetical protein